MPWSLQRFQETGDPHFVTFSCYRRQPFLRDGAGCASFEGTLERVRVWYSLTIHGYVIMPEHVHLLVSEPERRILSTAIQMLKQIVSRRLRRGSKDPFWQSRYYDRNVNTAREFENALQYIHRNPVKRGLCSQPEDWPWSSFLHHATGLEGVVEIESGWTARKRERMGVVPLMKIKLPHPPR